MINEVTKDNITFASLPEKYEAGTMPTAEVVAFNESIKFIENIGIKNIINHEKEITPALFFGLPIIFTEFIFLSFSRA